MPSTHVSRRRVLAGAGAAGAAALGGLTLAGDSISALGESREPVERTDLAGPWPMAGGDAGRTGRAAVAPPQPDASGNQLSGQFQTPVSGGARAAPAVGPERAYFGTATERVSSVGRRDWTARVDGWVASTPVVAEDAVYAVTTESTYALDAADGSTYWRVDAGGGAADASPVAADGTLYVPGGPGVTALEMRTGETVWEAETSLSLNGVAVADGRAVVTAHGNGDGYAAAFEAGEELWRLDAGKAVAAPTVVDGTAYLLAQDGLLAAVDLATGFTRWRTRLPSGNCEGVAVGRGRVYVPAGGGGRLHAVDAASGEVAWSHGTGVDFGAPALVDGALLAAGANTGIHVLDPESGDLRRHYERDERGIGIVGSALAPGDGAVYYVEGTGSNVYALA